MTGARKLAPANLVPAAAVIRGERVLYSQTGRKGFCGGGWEPAGLTRLKPSFSAGTLSLALCRGWWYSLTSVNMRWRREDGQGGSPPTGHDGRLGTKAWGAIGIRDPGSPRPDRWEVLFGALSAIPVEDANA